MPGTPLPRIAPVGAQKHDRRSSPIRRPGEAFGELALVSEAPRSATVAALEAAETYSLFRREFDALRREHPYVNRILVAVLAASVRRMDELIVEAFYVGAEKRVLRRLRDLAAVYGNGSPTITVPLTQEDLAGLAGTSRATVNRVLRDEESRGTVTLGRGKTVVVDLETLTRRAQ